MEQRVKEAGNAIKIEAEEEVEELGGSLQQRHQRPTKNSEVTTVSADLVSAGISTASANVSAITSEEQEQQPQLQQSVPCEEETGYDVERVLREQDTHDLFCPRCCSRITGKVIVRGRPNEPDVFRCLSCFTFFIPKGDCFDFLDICKGGDGPVRHPAYFEILKSMVYGGLVESIASLGVVSSAAGGGAATLNTLALALANLFSGLFVLVNSLRELKNERPSSAQTQTDDMEGDRYYQELGSRGKFPLHATLAVVSYHVFGLVAPITYGFSFRQSDDRDYKLAAVAAACLPCILLLALGKAHVGSKSYIKTALYYLTMGVTASGVSFLVGVLVDWLLERLGLFESGSSSTSFSGGFRLMSPPPVSGWASY